MDSDTDYRISIVQRFFQKHKNLGISILKYLIIAVFVLRGVGGFWIDLKDHIIEAELGKKPVTVTIDVKEDKYNPIKEKVYKEKGIILSNEEIDKYGFVK